MNYLGRPQADLQAAGGIWTAREIAQQPAVWTEIERMMTREADALRAFLDPLLERRDLRVVLTGAGTSAFVGQCLAPALKRRTRLRVDAVATTDLVGSPDSWLETTVPTLLVSFARSGNSPESVAALTLTEQGTTDCHHLIVTCNREGDLYRRGRQQRNAHVVLLPEQTNDHGFAMTSSFTGMMLAAALMFDLLPPDGSAALTRWAAHVLEAGLPLAARLASSGFRTSRVPGQPGVRRFGARGGAQDARTQRRQNRCAGRDPLGVSPRAQDHSQRQNLGGNVPL